MMANAVRQRSDRPDDRSGPRSPAATVRRALGAAALSLAAALPTTAQTAECTLGWIHFRPVAGKHLENIVAYSADDGAATAIQCTHTGEPIGRTPIRLYVGLLFVPDAEINTWRRTDGYLPELGDPHRPDNPFVTDPVSYVSPRVGLSIQNDFLVARLGLAASVMPGADHETSGAVTGVQPMLHAGLCGYAPELEGLRLILCADYERAEVRQRRTFLIDQANGSDDPGTNDAGYLHETLTLTGGARLDGRPHNLECAIGLTYTRPLTVGHRLLSVGQNNSSDYSLQCTYTDGSRTFSPYIGALLMPSTTLHVTEREGPIPGLFGHLRPWGAQLNEQVGVARLHAGMAATFATPYGAVRGQLGGTLTSVLGTDHVRGLGLPQHGLHAALALISPPVQSISAILTADFNHGVLPRTVHDPFTDASAARRWQDATFSAGLRIR